MVLEIDLPDELVNEATIVAAQRGITFDELVIKALQKELRASGDDAR